MFISLKRIIRAGWLAFKRQAGLSLATIFVMALTVFLVTLLFLFQQATLFLLSFLEEKADVSIYFTKETREEDILKIKDELVKFPELKDVKYVSHQEAVESLLQKHPELIESIQETEGLLNLASLNIRAAEPAQYVAVLNFLEAAPFGNLIEKVDYYQREPIIEKIFTTTSIIKNVGIFLILILSIIAFLITYSHVRLAIYNSKEEIGIQRLVGASNWFIRGPFLVQGVIAGIFAILICLLVFTPLLYFFSPKIEIFLPGLNLFYYFTANFFLILLLQLATVLTLGIISASLAIRKYLKV